jgi:hypothetical protein
VTDPVLKAKKKLENRQKATQMLTEFVNWYKTLTKEDHGFRERYREVFNAAEKVLPAEASRYNYR